MNLAQYWRYFRQLPQFDWSQRAIVGLILLITSGYLGNYFRWTLFFDIDFLFGSVAVWLVVCLYGTRWGTLAGFVAGLCTYVIWHHPYTTVTFTLEALFVGGLFHRQHRNIVLLDGLFWLLLGAPLVWLFYAIILRIDPVQAQIILLKQPVNGIFNALIASLLLTYLPIHRWVDRPQAIRTLAFRQTLFNLLMAFVLVPTLTLIILSSRQVVNDIRSDAQTSVAVISKYLVAETQLWYQQRVQAIARLAALVATAPTDLNNLAQSAEVIGQTFPDFHHIHVVDAAGNLLLDVDPSAALPAISLNATAQLEVDQHPAANHPIVLSRLYLEQVKRTRQPLLSQVYFHPGATPIPIVILGVPIFRGQTFGGMVLAEINLSNMNTVLKADIQEQPLEITLLDRQRTVIASTRPDWVAQPDFDRQQSGEIYPLAAGVYHWLPTQGSRLVMVRWNNSVFIKAAVDDQTGWSIIVELAATPYVQHIQQVHTRNMVLLLLICGVALVLASLVSRKIVNPIAQLAIVTTNLPHKLLEQEPIPWTPSRITELATLIQNFRLMAAALKQKFLEIQQVNETLEQRVQERTQALRYMNDQLAAEIAERLQAEVALRDSEERFRQMAENIREVFWMSSVDKQQLLYVSRAYEVVWGRSCESLYRSPESFVEAIHPEDRSRVLAAFSRQMQGTYSEEYRVIQPDGSERWIWDRAFPVRNAAGVVYRIVGVAQDITERKQAEEVLRQQAERERLLAAIAQRMRRSLDLEKVLNTTVQEVRQLLQADRVLIYEICNGTGRVITESTHPDYSTVLEQVLPAEMFPLECYQFYRQGSIRLVVDVETDDMSPCLVDVLRRLQVRSKLVVPILQGEDLWGLLIAHQCRSSRHWQAWEADLLRQLATQVAIAIQQSNLYQHEQRLNSILEAQVEERTAQLQQALTYEASLKRIIEKVRDSLDESQILQTVVKELVDSLQVYRCDTALFSSDQILLISHDLMTGVTATQTELVPSVNLAAIYPQLLAGQSLQFCDAVSLRQTDDPRAILVCPIIDNQAILGHLQLFRHRSANFSESEIRLVSQVANQCAIAVRQARLYQAAQIQVQALEELNQLKDDFLSTVSHELRTPISNMKMAIHMLKLSPTTDRRDRYLEILQTECIREADLINDLLDLQRLASGTKVLDLEAIPLPTWVMEVIEPFRERTQNREQTLQVNLPEHLPTLVSDAACLNRILAELLNNACKYTPPGEHITLTIQVRPHSYTTEMARAEGFASTGIVQLIVCNSGVEIPQQELPRLFDKFYRVPGIDRWKQGGTGLGLALVQKLAEHLGGTIRVESNSNRTCFTVELPIQTPSVTDVPN
ncbi:GAF domain-containing protein [Pantanalinema rosaneae CENA516]|uniref:GAF domain-containing protein n=1 Tax=Pantanalinema rosaneae TaxID=1620701 RepID=UPI003D6F0E88